MACGEGYGSDVLARRAGERRRGRRQPRGPRARPAALRAPQPALRARPGRELREPCDAVVFLQTIEHVEDPGAILDHFRSMLEPGGVAYVSTPNLLTLAPPGAEKSDNPWHLREYRAEEFRALCEAHFERVEMLGLFHARKLRAHEVAIGLGWDRVHRALRLTEPFYAASRRRSPAPISACGRGRSSARSTSSPSAMPERSAGDLAIVLHSHMPYVEGFGTYPFGEEWLFDAAIRSYLPVLDAARGVTLTVTPVLADQLEDAGARERLREFLRFPAGRGGRGGPRRGPAGVSGRLRGGAGALPAARSTCSTRSAATRCAPSGRLPRRGGSRWPPRPPPTPSCRCSPPGPRLGLQLDDGHPLAPAPLRLGRWLLAARVRLRARSGVAARRARRSLVLRRPERPRGAAGGAYARCGPRPGRSPCRSTGRRSSWLWSLDGYPSDPAHAQFAGKSMRGMRIWKVGGGAYDPEAARSAARRQAGEFLAAAATRLREFSAERRAPRPARLRDRHRAARPLVVGGRAVAARGDRRRRGGRGAAAYRARGPRRARAPPRRPRRLELGRGQGPAHLGLAPGRRPHLGGAPPRAATAARPLGRAAGARRAPRGAGAARRPVQRLGVPRPARPGRRLRLPAGDAPCGGGAGSHRLPARHRFVYACTSPGPEPRPAADSRDPSPDPLLGVPAADRGRPGPPRPQALRGAGRARGRGPGAHPRRRRVAGRGADQRRPRPPHPRAEAAHRPGRVRRLGRADELRHAGRRGGAGRSLQLRPRPRPRLAGRQRLRPPGEKRSGRRW